MPEGVVSSSIIMDRNYAADSRTASFRSSSSYASHCFSRACSSAYTCCLRFITATHVVRDAPSPVFFVLDGDDLISDELTLEPTSLSTSAMCRTPIGIR